MVYELHPLEWAMGGYLWGLATAALLWWRLKPKKVNDAK